MAFRPLVLVALLVAGLFLNIVHFFGNIMEWDSSTDKGFLNANMSLNDRIQFSGGFCELFENLLGAFYAFDEL